MRGTFTRYNLDFAEDVKHLLDQGFQNVSVEPVVTSPEYDYALRDEDIERILIGSRRRLSDMYLERALKGEPFDFFHFNVDLNQGPCVIKRISGCGAGTEYVAVSPEGDIYPCHQFVGDPSFKLGNLRKMKNLRIRCSISLTARISTIKKSAKLLGEILLQRRMPR